MIVPPRMSARYQSSARPVAAMAAPTLYRPASGAGVTNPPGTLDRPVPVDAEPAGRPARVVGVAGLEQARPRGSWRTRRRSRRRRGCPGRSPRASAAVSVRPPTTLAPVAVRGGSRSAGDARRRDAAGSRARSGPGRAGRRRPRSGGTPAIPRSRGTSSVAAATAGSWRSTQSAAGRPPSAQPRTPVAAASSSASAVDARVEEGDRRPGGLAAGVDGDERRAVAVDADRHDLGEVGGAQGPDGADDRRPPRARVLLGPAAAAVDVERVAARASGPAAGRRGRRDRP